MDRRRGGGGCKRPLVAPEPGTEIFREMPVIVRLEDGTIVEGRVDFAGTEGASWTFIDYKTIPPSEFAISARLDNTN